MSNALRSMTYENVNGVMLSLDIKTPSSVSNFKEFTITFKCDKKKTYSSKTCFLFAIMSNTIALSIMDVNLLAKLSSFLVFIFILCLWVTYNIKSESVIVIPLVGIQTSIKYIFREKNNFIPWSSIDDVIINEVIQSNRVLYFLTILTKETDEVKLVPVFKHTKPRLLMLESIYSEIQKLLKEAQYQHSDT